MRNPTSQVPDNRPTELYVLMILTKVSGSNIRLCYHSKPNADSAYQALKRPFQNPLNLDPVASDGSHDDVEVADDFGNTATVDRNALLALTLTHAQANSSADVEVSFLQQKAQLKLNKKLMADADVRASQSLAIPRNIMSS